MKYLNKYIIIYERKNTHFFIFRSKLAKEITFFRTFAEFFKIGMTLFTDIRQWFPITDPTWIFFVVLVIILAAPLVFNRLKIPHLVGMILAGVLIGEHGIGLLARDSSFELFGNVGLYYIMFLASLEMDMEGLKKNKKRGILFGILTFLIPFAIGYLVGIRVLHFSVPTSLLLSCILASHTLVAYPIVGRYGLHRNDCVTIAVCGTMIALLLSLIVLAVISASVSGGITSRFWLLLLAKTTIYAGIIFFLYPRLTRWFFKHCGDNITQFVFVMALMILSAAMSDFIGLQGLLGAFLAGLVLNRYIPHVSPLLNRIEFVGNALFIPYFLIGVGMLIDLGSLFQSTTGWIVMGVMVLTAIGSKWIAAWMAQLLMRFRSFERELLFGLSSAHAAGALAMVMVGTQLMVAPGTPLMSEEILNGVVLMILVTCIISSIATDHSARHIAVEEAARPKPEDDAPEKLMVALNNPDNVEELINTAIMMRNPKATNELTAIQVSIDNAHTGQQKEMGRTNLKKAADIAASADVPLVTQNRVGNNVAGSILHAFKEADATELILGLHHKRSFADSFLGGTTTDIINGTHRQVVIMKYLMPINVAHRIIVAIPEKAELETGFYRWLERICRMGEQLGCRVDFHGHPATQHDLETYIHSAHPNVRFMFVPLADWNDLLIVTENLSFDHLFVLVSARRGSLSWQPSFDNLPAQLMKYFSNNSLMIIYPEQYDSAQEPTFAQPFI